MDDRQIVDLFWQRREDALVHTRARYGAYCGSIAQRILGNTEDAEECVNDTWLQAWNAIPPAKPAHLRLFLGRITRNLAINAAKKQKAEKRGGGQVTLALEELAECLPAADDVQDDIQQKALERAIRQFLNTLPPRDCTVFLYRYFYMEPPVAIAKRIGIRENHVLLILSRTRAKLREFLQKEWDIYDV